jgi:hypothetical protein
MATNKTAMALTALVGLVIATISIVMRFQAHDLVWPESYGFMGSWQDTVWGRKQLALEQVSLLTAAFGFGLMLIACHGWLNSGASQTDPTA